MNGVGRADEKEKATKLAEKEENNNKKNKRPLEEEKAEETRKKAATDEGVSKPIFGTPSFGGNSDFSPMGGSPKAGKLTSNGNSKLEASAATQSFTFSPPTTVITQASLVPASVEYQFSFPTPMVIQQEAGLVTNSPLPRTPRTVSTQGDRRLAVAQKHHPVASPPKMMFSAMPDVTNNLVRKPHSSDTGAASMQRLPDLGLGPASQLRTGSVMDI